MGKSSSTQPKHSVIPEPSIRHPARRRGRSKTASRQRDSTKPSAPAVNEPTSQPPSPSPLNISLSEEYYDARETFSPTSTSFIDEDGDIFYDADDSSVEHKPVLAAVQQVIPDPRYDGAAKGAIHRRSGPARNTIASNPVPTSPLAPAPMANFGGFSFSPNRGSTKPAVSPVGPSAATLAAQEARKAVPPSPSPIPSRPTVKKALVVGMNYTSLGDDKRLYYAINDAKRWRDTLLSKGVSSENIKIITDEGDARDAPSYNNLLAHIRWLVRDARAGDSLFFVFSGHAIVSQHYGPSILTADKMIFAKPLLEKELVMAIPKGADLQVVFDCCHSAGMIGLQYCVGRMAKPTPTPSPEQHAEQSAACPLEPEPSESQGAEHTGTAPPRPASPFSHAPQQASLYGIHAAAEADVTPQPLQPAPVPPVTPDMVNMDTFGPSPHRHPRGGVVAAPSLPAAAATAAGNQPGLAASAVNYITSFMGYGATSTQASTSTPAQTPASSEPVPRPPAPGPRRANQGVVEGTRLPDYFEEREVGFVSPAGKVMVWAGAGEHQQAFETYGRARQGIVTKAMCGALAPCVNQAVTCRDLWSYLVQEIDGENKKRMERDASKSINERQLPHLRVQHAELWVSQCDPLEPLRSAGPVLDRPML